MLYCILRKKSVQSGAQPGFRPLLRLRMLIGLRPTMRQILTARALEVPPLPLFPSTWHEFERFAAPGILNHPIFDYASSVKRTQHTATHATPPGTTQASPPPARHGSIYTRPWVAELVLDLAGYDATENLVDTLAIEPSCGNGEFLGPMIRRLSESCRRQGRSLRDCSGSLAAFDVNPEAVAASRRRTEAVLVDCGWGPEESRRVADGWVREADFLLDGELDFLRLAGGGAGFVLGNPPYVRLEAIDPEVAETYRKRYRAMTGRADLYVGFYERALDLLAPEGVCGFICADRWMLNQYGSSLRKLVTTGGFAVEAVVEMHTADAFHDEVLAYPAVTVIRKADQGQALVAKVEREADASAGELAKTARSIRSSAPPDDGAAKDRSVAHTAVLPGRSAVVVDEWFEGADPWPCVSPERLGLLKRLEGKFGPLQDPATGTRVGIGVATGADKVFLTKDAGLVEEDRLLPMAMAKDTATGELAWSGHHLVNPWGSDGNLVDLSRYPRLARYFEGNAEVLKGRNVGKKNPERWYRTIDKVNHALTAAPKLLIPDIKSVAHPVLDEGLYYPHHNLYFVVSEAWDLKVLGGILLSRVGQFFVECYAVRMNGGFLRFQAQYLRRIRVPRPEALTPRLERELARAFEERDAEAATGAALEAYGIDGIPD